MTTLLDAPETDLHADAMPVIKKTAVQAASADPVPTKPADESVRPAKDWFSGWCNGFAKGGECTDGKRTTKVGEPIINCLYEGINGEKVPTRVIYCACACHDARRDPEDPNLGIVRTEKDTAARAAKTAAQAARAAAAVVPSDDTETDET